MKSKKKSMKNFKDGGSVSPRKAMAMGYQMGWQCRCEKSTVICAKSWKYDAGFCSNA